MSHPGRRVLRGANPWPHAPRALAAVATPRLRGSRPTRPDGGPGGRAHGRAGERVMSRAAVGGSPGGEAPPGEFSESSAALH